MDNQYKIPVSETELQRIKKAFGDFTAVSCDNLPPDAPTSGDSIEHRGWRWFFSI